MNRADVRISPIRAFDDNYIFNTSTRFNTFINDLLKLQNLTATIAAIGSDYHACFTIQNSVTDRISRETGKNN